MQNDYPWRSALRDPLVKWFLGFFGAVFGFLMLPRTIKYLLRRFVLGTLSEIVVIVITGLLTEKMVAWIGKDDAQRSGIGTMDNRSSNAP